MNRFEQWFLKRLIAKQVRQGFSHHIRIRELYTYIRNATREEFFEDNEATIDQMLRNNFESTQTGPTEDMLWPTR